MHTRCGSPCAVSSNDSSTPTPRRSDSSQERRLRALVRVVAARSPFYREYFRESGVNPRSIRTLEDLPQLPLLTRDHLLERIDDLRVYPRRLMWTARSSGTSGRPIGVYRTPGRQFTNCARWNNSGVGSAFGLARVESYCGVVISRQPNPGS